LQYELRASFRLLKLFLQTAKISDCSGNC